MRVHETPIVKAPAPVKAARPTGDGRSKDELSTRRRWVGLSTNSGQSNNSYAGMNAYSPGIRSIVFQSWGGYSTLWTVPPPPPGVSRFPPVPCPLPRRERLPSFHLQPYLLGTTLSPTLRWPTSHSQPAALSTSPDEAAATHLIRLGSLQACMKLRLQKPPDRESPR